MNAVFLSFNKRENSTKQPTAAQLSAGTTYDIVLLETTSITEPSIRLKANSTVTGYNYVYIAPFSRYYHITGWESDHGLWVAHCKVDVLASYRSAVMSSNQFVSRTYGKVNPYITDGAGFPTSEKESKSLYFDGPFYHPSTVRDDACILVCTIGGYQADVTAPVNGFNYYAMTPAQLRALINFLNNDIENYLDITEISTELTKALYNPFQFIVSVKMFPFEILHEADTSYVQFGYWVASVPAYKVIYPYFDSNQKPIYLYKHPQLNEGYNNYINRAPYSEYILHAQPFGDVPLDANLIGDYTHLYAYIMVDCLTGTGRLEVLPFNNATEGSKTFQQLKADHPLVYEGCAQVGVDIPISNLSSSNLFGMAQGALSFASGAVTAVSGAITKNPIDMVSGIQGALSGATEIESAGQPRPAVTGCLGSMLSWQYRWAVECIHHTQSFINNAEVGYPYYNNVNPLSQTYGYTEVPDPDLLTSGTLAEHEELKNLMQLGFFLE